MSESPSVYSFVTKDRQSLELFHPEALLDNNSVITLDIIETSLTANNKFYLDFGDKPPFHFDKCYPVNGSLVQNKDTSLEGYIHPPVWGVCKVVQSTIENAPVGTLYTAMLPIASQVSFANAHVNEKSGNLIIDRPTTHSAYNEFRKIHHYNEEDRDLESMKLVCGPGYLTGFGLYFALEEKGWYGCKTVVLTSASSKVSLALAFYMKQNATTDKKISVVGLTSDSNRGFCQSTGLYDTILGYDATLQENCVMIDVAGNAKPFLNNRSKVIKLLAIGNSSGSKESDGTFGCFSTSGKIKMILSMMGAPTWIHSFLNPTEELFLIMNTMKDLEAKWTSEKLEEIKEEHSTSFCKAAMQWIKVRRCDTEESIVEAFRDIVTGKASPSDAVSLDAAKATKHRSS